MLTLAKRTLTAAAVITAAWAPSAATARVNLNPSPAPLTSSPATGATSVHARSGSLSGPATPVTAHPAGAGRPTETAVQSQFAWADAGIGAAGMLLLLGTGAGSAAAISRRRGHQTRVSPPVRG